MKKFLLFIVAFCICASAGSFGALAADGEEIFTDEQIEYYKSLNLQGSTVNVYNWGEYISDGSEGSMDVIAEFERLTGAKVNYTNFESNENMYSKLSGGGVSYDVIVPSDYMVSRLIDEDMLLELDYDNIPNIKNIDEQYLNLYFDSEQKYSVCYNVGTTVLIYNKNLVAEEPDSWSVLWDEQYKNKILMFNNSRDAFAIAQFLLGQDVNTSSEADWSEAARLLAEQKDAVNPVYVMDEVFNLMESGEYAFATYYAGDYLLMLDNNEDLGYCFPKEGVNLFYDAFCIPQCAQNKAGGEAFINFMLEEQVALANAEYIYYASPNTTVINNPEYSLYENEAVYPAETPAGQYFENLPQNLLELQADLWTAVKSGSLSADSDAQNLKIYICSAAVAAAGIAALISRLVFKRKKAKEEDLSDLYD
ncbi:MAG: spermidine/putrescine ABC transporter substrate-binding protein [Clostridiales bacterium]|nr:spermidine/putrescine ABC transporter substrate-binding protein [Clostridiales bacterium]